MNKSKYQKLRNAGKLFGTIKRAVELRNKRGLNKVRTIPTINLRYNKSRILIPLGSVESEQIKPLIKANSRKHNWDTRGPGFYTYIRTNDLGNYSGRCRYTHYTYTPIIQSYAIILRYKNQLRLQFDGKTYLKKAPQGYKWDSDENGIKIVSIKNSSIDYHVTAFDLTHNNWFNAIRNNARNNYKIRQKNLKELLISESRIKRAIKTGCCVRLNDSLSSGNCLAGTKNWMKRHNIKSNYMPIKDVIQFISDNRVKLTVLYSVRRHLNSLKLGYSTI